MPISQIKKPRTLNFPQQIRNAGDGNDESETEGTSDVDDLLSLLEEGDSAEVEVPREKVSRVIRLLNSFLLADFI